MRISLKFATTRFLLLVLILTGCKHQPVIPEIIQIDGGSISRYMPDNTSSKSHFIYRKSDKVIFTLSEKDSFSTAFGPAYHIDKNGDLFLPVKPLEAMNCKAWTHYFETNKLNITADNNPVMVKLNIKSIINKQE